MDAQNKIANILMADDDDDDFLLVKTALKNSDLPHTLHHVSNGEELMDYLLRKEPYTNTKDYPFPSIVLLDLNMPKKDGREALAEIKSNEDLCRIPIVVLSTSNNKDDIYKCYKLGVNSYIRKPADYKHLVSIFQAFKQYWFEIVELPED